MHTKRSWAKWELNPAIFSLVLLKTSVNSTSTLPHRIIHIDVDIARGTCTIRIINHTTYDSSILVWHFRSPRPNLGQNPTKYRWPRASLKFDSRDQSTVGPSSEDSGKHSSIPFDSQIPIPISTDYQSSHPTNDRRQLASTTNQPNQRGARARIGINYHKLIPSADWWCPFASRSFGPTAAAHRAYKGNRISLA